MVDGHQDMEGWGVYSIFKEAGRLLYHHFRIFRPFILAFLLPFVLIMFLEVIGLAWLLAWAAEQGKLLNLGVVFGHHRHFGFHVLYAAFSKDPNLPDLVPDLDFVLVTFILNFLIFTICWVLQSLTTATLAKAIHHIYSSNNNNNTSPNQTLALTQSIFTSLLYYFYRIFIISLCFFVVDILTYFLLVFPFSLFSRPQPSHLQMLDVWVWSLVFLILDFWFLVSIQVVVLENQYNGWTALQQSAKLVKAKAVTALGLLGVYFVYFYVLIRVLVVVIIIPAHSMMLYVVVGALAVEYLAFWSFWSVVVTVFYFVSKCKCSNGGEEGWHHAKGRDLYQALDVPVEN